MYNILWIDDEYDKMPAFRKECELIHNLHLEPFRTRKEGMEALEKDLDKWHAVLLDAKMFDETENEVPQLTGLMNAKQRLDQLKMKKDVPYFVSTGQPDLISSDNFRAMFGGYYIKGKDDVKLIEDMKCAIEKSDAIQVIYRYNDVFNALDSLGNRDVTESILTDILLPLHFPADEPNFKPLHHYNQLRQLLEYIFRACNKVGLIPDQCMDGQNVNLSQSSLYLAGKNANIAGVRYGNDGDRVIPIYIENFIRSILDFGNSQSHTVELTTADKQNVESIFRAKKSQYIIFSLAMQICEVIIWIDRYISDHNDKAVNLSKCKVLPKDGAKYNGLECLPVKDEKGLWHCEECLVIVKPENVGKTLKLRDIRPNTSTSKDIYPYFAYFDIVK